MIRSSLLVVILVSCVYVSEAFTIVSKTQTQRSARKLTLSSTSNDEEKGLASDVRRAFLASSLAAVTYNVLTIGIFVPPGFRKASPIQFSAALGDPNASSGTGAEKWGLWPVDPGPRGIGIRDYEKIRSGDATAPSWFNEKDFFLDENAIIMPQPEFPMPPGRYYVTGGRLTKTVLTIDPPDTSGQSKWRLDSGTLYDVTHLPCRAARYTPNGAGGGPATVNRSDFPVRPGGMMPEVSGTDKRDYSVIFIIGIAEK